MFAVICYSMSLSTGSGSGCFLAAGAGAALTTGAGFAGEDVTTALDWIARTDEPNARRIEATRGRADQVFRWPAQRSTPS